MKFKHTVLICFTCGLILQACTQKEPIQQQLDIATASPSPISFELQQEIKETVPDSTLEEKTFNLSKLLNKNDLKRYFEQYDNATMLLTDGVSNVTYNETFSEERHSPFSTFKIPNSLIALEEGVVSIHDSFRKWDGTRHNRQELNQDQDIASAMKNSCVWYYKQLANEIGSESIQLHINNIGYGNMDILGGVDEFWLGSSLLISPKEQLDFIIKLYNNELPFQPDNMNYVKSIMKQDGYPIDLYGKTGSSGDGMGWFVGYVLLNEKPVFFATYIEGDGTSGLVARDLTAQIINDFMVY